MILAGYGARSPVLTFALGCAAAALRLVEFSQPTNKRGKKKVVPADARIVLTVSGVNCTHDAGVRGWAG